jgi:hypothetical protein
MDPASAFAVLKLCINDGNDNGSGSSVGSALLGGRKRRLNKTA